MKKSTIKSVFSVIKWCKSVIIIFVFIFFAPLFADAGALSKPPNNLGLMGYWPFEEGVGTRAGDYSGNGNNGTLTNGPTWDVGKKGSALHFDGSDSYVTRTGNNVASTSGTITAWVKSDLLSGGSGCNVHNGSGSCQGVVFSDN